MCSKCETLTRVNLPDLVKIPEMTLFGILFFVWYQVGSNINVMSHLFDSNMLTHHFLQVCMYDLYDLVYLWELCKLTWYQSQFEILRRIDTFFKWECIKYSHEAFISFYME